MHINVKMAKSRKLSLCMDASSTSTSKSKWVVIHPDFETKRSRHQKIETGVPVPSPTKFFLLRNVNTWGPNKTLNLANIDLQH